MTQHDGKRLGIIMPKYFFVRQGNWRAGVVMRYVKRQMTQHDGKRLGIIL